MEKAIQFFLDQLVGIRWGTVTPALVDSVKADYYGQKTLISHLASTRPDQGRIMVNAHDPQAVGSINTALRQAGFNSYVFSKTAVVVSVPPPSGDEKKKVQAHIAKLAEEAKIAVRNVRKKVRQHVDDLGAIDKPLQRLTDESIKQIDDIAKDKIESQ